MKTFKVKFFGANSKHEQLRQVKTEVEANSREEVESVLEHKLGFKVINGLKIRNNNS